MKIKKKWPNTFIPVDGILTSFNRGISYSSIYDWFQNCASMPFCLIFRSVFKIQCNYVWFIRKKLCIFSVTLFILCIFYTKLFFQGHFFLETGVISSKWAVITDDKPKFKVISVLGIGQHMFLSSQTTNN